MKHLKIDENGGFRLRRSDFRWLISGMYDRFRAYIAGIKRTLPIDTTTSLPAATMVITGADMTLIGLTQATWTEGVVMIDGEMRLLPASTAPLALSNPSTERWYIIPDTSTFSITIEGHKQFADFTFHDVHEVKMAKVVVLPRPQPHLSLEAPVRYMSGITNADTNFSPMSLSGPGFTYTTCSLRINALGYVELRGTIQRTATSADVVGVVEARFRPTDDRYINIPNADLSQGALPGLLKIQPNGNMYIYSQGAQIGDIYILSGHSYSI